jgi:general stress protein 26
MDRNMLNILQEKIGEVDIAMFTTLSPEGNPHSRPMSTMNIDENGILWFFTSQFSKKANEIIGNNSVNLSYTNPESQVFVSISGKAEIIHDKKLKQELWTPVLKVWFPLGVKDPDLRLIRIFITEAEYWDAGSNKMVQLFEMAKALVNGEEFANLTHKKYNLNETDEQNNASRRVGAKRFSWNRFSKS